MSPAYTDRGPAVAIDEPRTIVDTAGRLSPFAQLLTQDGYRIVPSRGSFDRDTLARINVLVIAPSTNEGARPSADGARPPLADADCDALRDWVRTGGSLLLVVDHASAGNDLVRLAERFGVTMGKGLVFDRVSGGGITTQLEFSRANGRLGNHAILRGRGAGERIDHVRSIAGQSLGGPAKAVPLMTFGATAREAETTTDLEDEDAASRQEAALAGAFSTPVRGRPQGLALSFGSGRVVVLGAVTLLPSREVDDGHESTIGIGTAGTNSRQFALNTLHWLSHLLN